MRFLSNILLLFLMLPEISFGQETKLIWSQDQRYSNRQPITEMAEDGRGNFVVVKRTRNKQGSGILLDLFDGTTLEIGKSKFLSSPVLEKGPLIYQDILLLNDKLYLFYTDSYSKDGFVQLYAFLLSADLDLTGDKYLLAEVKRTGKRQEVSFELVSSPSNDRLLVFHQQSFESYKDEEFLFHLLDGEMQTVWKKNLSFPFPGKRFRFTHQYLDKDGNVHLLNQISLERVKESDDRLGSPNNQYQIISYYPEENKIKEFEISLPEKWITAVSCGLTPSGELVAGGFYSNKKEYGIAGTFYIRINTSSREIVSKNMMPFEKNFLRQFLPERKINKGVELSDFYFDHFTVREDGSVVFIAEQYYMQILTNYNMDPFYSPYWGYGYGSPYYGPNYTYQYHYQDLIVVSVDSSGTIEWAKKIPKSQVSSNDGGYYLSYAYAEKDGNVCLLFNDNPRNTADYRKSGQEVYTMNKTSRAVVTSATISRDGKLDYISLFSSKESGYYLRPKFHFQEDSGDLILFTRKGKKYRFLKADFSSLQK